MAGKNIAYSYNIATNFTALVTRIKNGAIQADGNTLITCVRYAHINFAQIFTGKKIIILSGIIH